MDGRYHGGEAMDGRVAIEEGEEDLEKGNWIRKLAPSRTRFWTHLD